MASTPYSRLRHVLEKNKGLIPATRKLSPQSCSAQVPASCASFSLNFSRVDNGVKTVAELGQLLHLLALLARVGVSPQCLVDSYSYGCPIAQWCSYCDGGDRRVKLRLEWGGAQGTPAALETALFDSDESSAKPPITRIREAIDDVIGATPAQVESTSRERQPPVEISLLLLGYSWDENGVNVQGEQQLRSLFARFAGSSLVSLTRVDVQDVSTAMAATIARTRVPVANESEYKWTWLVEQGEDGLTILETAEIKQLSVLVEGEHEPDLSHRLHNVLRTRPTAVSELLIEYDHLARRTNLRRPQLEEIAGALLAPTSVLQGSLTRLTIRANFTQQDVLAIAARLLADTETKAETSCRLTELVCEGWDWQNVKGATLTELLLRCGKGLNSLRLAPSYRNRRSYVPVSELPALTTSCRSLDVFVSCSNWTKLAAATAGQAPNPKLQGLRLRPTDRDSAIVRRALGRLLPLVGGSLTSLALTPRSSDVAFSADSATIIVQSCPQLRELSVLHVDEAFIAQLVEGIAAGVACRLERLTLRSRRPATTFAPLLTALRVPTHPLSRSLRSLRFEMVKDEDRDAVNALMMRLHDVLKVNTRLQHATICGKVDASWVDDARDNCRNCEGMSTVLPPLRHRLAVLSALGHQKQQVLPQLAAMNVLEFVGHCTRRLRVETTSDAESDDEEDDDEDDADY